MFEISPRCQFSATCPYCGGSAESERLDFQGIHVLGFFRCVCCQKPFWSDLPCGHGLPYPVFLDEAGHLVNDVGLSGWFSQPLIDGFNHRLATDVMIEKRVFRECDDVLLLNCLDYLYGHVLLKLFNAQRHMAQDPDIGIIVLIPEGFEWLVPEGVAEVWVVHLRLGELRNWYVGIHRFVAEQLLRFRQVFLSKAYLHPNFSRIDMAKFTRCAPFELSQFAAVPPQVTFVLREDRLWFRGPALFFVYRVLRKLGGLHLVHGIFVALQNRLIRSAIDLVQRDCPGVQIVLVGLGRTGHFPESVRDLRVVNMTESVEQQWCEAYSKSHVVVGIHGSNMILPTGLAAGFVEILPHDRYGNLMQDIAMGYSDRRLAFLGRFVDEFATPQDVVRHCVSIMTHFGEFYRHLNEGG